MIARRIFILFFLCSTFTFVAAQSRKAQALVDKDKYDQAFTLLHKSFKKDSASVEVFWALSKLHLAIEFEKSSIDSAHYYILEGQKAWVYTTEKQKDKLLKKQIDSLELTAMHHTIDSLKFQFTEQQNTIEAYAYYEQQYPQSNFLQKAINQKEKLLLRNAINNNTAAALLKFTTNHPKSIYYTKAYSLYDSLLYEETTVSKDFDGYTQFVANHPKSKYIPQAKAALFKFYTASHEPELFKKYLELYPDSPSRYKTLRLLSLIDFEFYRINYNQSSTFDTLNRVYQTLQLTSYLTVANGVFNYIDSKGKILFEEGFTTIDPSQHCEKSNSPLVLIQNGSLRLKNGTKIAQGKFKTSEYFGKGWFTLETDTGIQLRTLYDSTLRIDSKNTYWVSDKNEFLVIKNNKQLALLGINGHTLLKVKADTVLRFNDTFLLKKKSSAAALSFQDLKKQINKNQLAVQFRYEDIKIVENRYLWFIEKADMVLKEKNGHFQGEFIGFEALPKDSIALIEAKDHFVIVDNSLKLLASTKDKEILKNRAWISVRDSLQQYFVYNRNKFSYSKIKADSLQTLGNHFLLAYYGDSTRINGPFLDQVRVPNSYTISLLKQSNSLLTEFISLEFQNKKQVYNANLDAIITHKWEEIKPIGPDMLVVKRRGKKGIVAADGALVVRPTYDAIASYEKESVALLKRKKFGLYSYKNNILIPSEYDKRIRYYNSRYLIASKEGKLGLIDHDNNSILSFQYDGIEYWNDSTALVKENYLYQMVNIHSNTVQFGGFKDYQHLAQQGDRETFLVLKDNYYGVINSKGEVLLKTGFESILNIGSEKMPFYQVEKYIEEADYHIFLYYDAAFTLVYKQLVEGEMVDALLCD